MAQIDSTPRLGLVRYDAMCRAIAECSRVDEAKDIRDKARALEVYAAQAQNKEAEYRAAEIRIRAERRTGELLAATKDTGQRESRGRPEKRSPDTTIFKPATLAEIGITKDQSSEWQKLAAIPRPEFERRLTRAIERPTTTAIVHFSSETGEWYTPEIVVAAVISVLGKIELDPCAEPRKGIPAAQHFTEKDDGLSREWKGNVYMNPPYGREINPWVAKLKSEHLAGRVPKAIALVPARTDTNWFREFRDFAVCFLDGRLKFSGHTNSAPFPSAAFYLGKRIDAFAEGFSRLGDTWVRYGKGR